MPPTPRSHGNGSQHRPLQPGGPVAAASQPRPTPIPPIRWGNGASIAQAATRAIAGAPIPPVSWPGNRAPVQAKMGPNPQGAPAMAARTAAPGGKPRPPVPPPGTGAASRPPQAGPSHAPPPSALVIMRKWKTQPAQAGSRAGAKAGVIQPMIVVADPPSADVGRMVAVANMMERYPGYSVAYLDEADLSTMDFNDTLFISAHGGGDTVGGMTPGELASKLLQRGLKTGTKIDLRACYSGTTFAKKLAKKIRQRSKRKAVVLVNGYTGTGVILENGGYRAKDSDLNVGAMEAEYKQIIKEGFDEDDDEAGDLPGAKDFITMQLLFGGSLAEIAPAVKRMTQTTFSRLYEHNWKVLKSIGSGNNSSSLTTYLKEMDPQFAKNTKMLERIRQDEIQRWKDKPASYFA